MVQLLPLLAVVPLLVFYLWMFHDMVNNHCLNSNPWALLGIAREYSPSANPTYNWTMAFLVLNVFAAAMYYFAEYRR